MTSDRDDYASETYGHGEVENYVEPRRPTGPSDEEISRTIRAQLWKRVAFTALATALVLMLGGIGYTTYAVRQQQTASAQRLKVIQATAVDARHATERIEDCTTPGRGCFKQEQKRSAELVGGLNATSIRAAAAATVCASQIDPQTYKEILACVALALKTHESK